MRHPECNRAKGELHGIGKSPHGGQCMAWVGRTRGLAHGIDETNPTLGPELRPKKWLPRE